MTGPRTIRVNKTLMVEEPVYTRKKQRIRCRVVIGCRETCGFLYSKRAAKTRLRLAKIHEEPSTPSARKLRSRASEAKKKCHPATTVDGSYLHRSFSSLELAAGPLIPCFISLPVVVFIWRHRLRFSLFGFLSRGLASLHRAEETFERNSEVLSCRACMEGSCHLLLEHALARAPSPLIRSLFKCLQPIVQG